VRSIYERVRIVVNHVTRMRAPRICVAGIDIETRAHIRPTRPASAPLTRSVLKEEGGPFEIGAIVDLGRVEHRPSPPECEDHRFQLSRARPVEDLSGADFLDALDRVSAASLEDGFGPSLERVGWKYAVEVGAGDRSLDVVRAVRRPVLDVDRTYGRLQLRFNDSDLPAYLPVTDLRFYETDQVTICRDVVADVARRLKAGVDAYLMLGLARAYRAQDDDRDRHWLQLNGLCLVDRPVGSRP
jgi:hypothetical protein